MLKSTRKKVATDEIYYNDIGENYTTAPHIDLQGLNLEKDAEGNYVVPENATGEYQEDTTEVNYYYEAEPINLTIHHYMEGTEDKLVEDEVIKTDAQVTFDEEGNYEVSTEESYVIKENLNYNNLKKQFNLASTKSTITSKLTIESTLDYSEDTEMTYYYNEKSYEYSVRYFYDGVEDEENKETKIVSTNDPISTYQDKNKENYRFDRAVALNSQGEETELPLQITDNVETNVINVYYNRDNYRYEVHYYYDGEEKYPENTGKFIALLGTQITDYVDKKVEGYKFEKVKALNSSNEEEDLPLTIREDVTKNRINVYYTKITDINYTVNYLEKYTNKVIHEPKTVTNQPFGEKINSENEVIEIEDYIFDSYDPEELTIVEDETKNVINIYYKYTYQITTSVKEHEETNEDGTTVLVKGGTISGEGETPYEEVYTGEDSIKEIEIKPDEGYRIEKVLIISGEEEKEIDVSDFKDENGIVKLNAENNYFTKVDRNYHVQVSFNKLKEAEVIEKHIDITTGEILDSKTTEGTEGEEYNIEPREFEGYKLVEEKLPENAKGTMTIEPIEVKYYYKKIEEPKPEEPEEEPVVENKTFNLKINKTITKILVDESPYAISDGKFTKVEINRKKLNETNIKVEYTIKVTNTGNIEGKAKIVENIPENFEIIAEENPQWKINKNNAEIEIENIKAGETKEYKIILQWKKGDSNIGTIQNIVNLSDISNAESIEEETLEDNKDGAVLIITISTGEEILIFETVSILILIIEFVLAIGTTKKIKK